MSPQSPPSDPHSCHWYVNVHASSHDPGDDVSTRPTAATPEIAGGALSCGTQEVVLAPVFPIVTATGEEAIPFATTRSLDAPVGVLGGSVKSVHEAASGAIERLAIFAVRAYVTTPLSSLVICTSAVPFDFIAQT